MYRRRVPGELRDALSRVCAGAFHAAAHRARPPQARAAHRSTIRAARRTISGRCSRRSIVNISADACRRPRLGWSARPWRSQFGCFDPSLNQIVMNRRLDRPDVPSYAVEFILYHEMLHVKHPVARRRVRVAGAFS